MRYNQGFGWACYRDAVNYRDNVHSVATDLNIAFMVFVLKGRKRQSRLPIMTRF